MNKQQWCDEPVRDQTIPNSRVTLSSSSWSFSASSSVSSWILGPSSLFFFFSSAAANFAALSVFSFLSRSSFSCFSLWAFCASLLWWSNESLTSWKRDEENWAGGSQSVGRTASAFSSPCLQHPSLRRRRNRSCAEENWKMCWLAVETKWDWI